MATETLEIVHAGLQMTGASAMAPPQGYVKAKLAIEGGETIQVLFNPTEYTITKGNNWTFDPIKGNSLPKGKFGGGKPREMQVNLLLDQTLPNGGKTVKQITDKLFKMMEVKGGTGAGARRAVPPLVTFQWGEMIPFKAACTSLTVAFQLFKPNGTPIRADVKLALTQAETATLRSAKSKNKQRTRRRARTAGSASTWSRTATRCSRSPTTPTATRTAGASIAEANGIDNPLHLRRGAAQPAAARLMTGAGARRRPASSRSTARSTPTGRGRADRGAQLHRASRTWRRSAWPIRRASTSPTRSSRSATRSRSSSATTEMPPGRCSWARSSPPSTSSRRRRRSLLPRLRRLAPPAAQPPDRDLPEDDDGGHRQEGRRAARPAAPGRSTRPRPSTRSCSRAWRPTSTSSAGSRRWTTASSGSRRQGLPRQRRNGTGPTPAFEWRTNVHLVQAADDGGPAARHVTVPLYDPSTKRPFIGHREEPAGWSGPRRRPATAASGSGRSELLIADRIVAPRRGTTLAQSTLDSLAGGSFEAEGVMQGDPA